MGPFVRRQANPRSGTSRAFPLSGDAGSLKEILLIGLTEMMPINRKRYGQRQQLGTAKTRPYQELPVVNSLFTYDAKVVDGTKECQKMLKVHRSLNLRSPIFPQEGPEPLVVVLG